MKLLLYWKVTLVLCLLHMEKSTNMVVWYVCLCRCCCAVHQVSRPGAASSLLFSFHSTAAWLTGLLLMIFFFLNEDAANRTSFPPSVIVFCFTRFSSSFWELNVVTDFSQQYRWGKTLHSKPPSSVVFRRKETVTFKSESCGCLCVHEESS